MQRQSELLEQIYESQMGTFVQITRLYDVFAAVGAGATEDAVSALIAAHADGDIDTAPPFIKSWAEGMDDDDE